MSEAADPLEASADGRRPSWSLFRSALDAAGFRPSKTLGQNFLVDPNAARSIAEDAGLERGARVLEVGAGCGFLTFHLARRGLEVLAVEIDARLLELAQRLLAGESGVRWLHADALATKHRLAVEVLAELPASEPWHLVSNLPYSISAPLLVVLARLPNPPRTMTALIQDEVARRVAAQPGEAEWGALSARLALGYEARAGRAVGAQLFWPRPRVASRVVHLVERSSPRLGPAAVRAYDALVDDLFRHRRKQLVRVLTEAIGERSLAQALADSLGLDPRIRPEGLTTETLLALSRAEPWTSR